MDYYFVNRPKAHFSRTFLFKFTPKNNRWNGRFGGGANVGSGGATAVHSSTVKMINAGIDFREEQKRPPEPLLPRRATHLHSRCRIYNCRQKIKMTNRWLSRFHRPHPRMPAVFSSACKVLPEPPGGREGGRRRNEKSIGSRHVRHERYRAFNTRAVPVPREQRNMSGPLIAVVRDWPARVTDAPRINAQEKFSLPLIKFFGFLGKVYSTETDEEESFR